MAVRKKAGFVFTDPEDPKFSTIIEKKDGEPTKPAPKADNKA